MSTSYFHILYIANVTFSLIQLVTFFYSIYTLVHHKQEKAASPALHSLSIPSPSSVYHNFGNFDMASHVQQGEKRKESIISPGGTTALSPGGTTWESGSALVDEKALKDAMKQRNEQDVGSMQPTKPWAMI